MTTYKKIVFEGKECAVFRNDGTNFPLDPANTDYQQYLAWCAEGNTPEPAEEQQ